MRRQAARIVLRVVALSSIAYLVILALLFLYQRDLMYPRDPTRADPRAAGLAGLEEVMLTAEDGERLVAWVVPPRAGKPVLLFFHGNAGNFDRRFRRARFKALTADGTGLFAVNYRGYGGSTGRPSEEGLARDARAAHAAAAARFGADRLVGYGESLGTGVVLRLAGAAALSAVILEAPYLSTAAVARLTYPFVPIGLLMHDQFRSDRRIGALRVPLLVLHGGRDRIIPFGHGEALFALAAPPKRFVGFPEGGHEDLPAHGSLVEIGRFLADLAAGRLNGSETLTVRR